jgi:TRAP-type C4-dicarboxylate transport system permease small subunit
MLKLKHLFEKILEAISIALLVALALIVVLAVVFRYSGAALIWYDETASVLLVWLTYYGSALAACNRGHLGFPGLFLAFPKPLRMVAFVLAETVIIGFFAIVGYAGLFVLRIFREETLITVPWLKLSFTQSVIPLGAVLFILAEILSMPDAWSNAMAGIDYEKVAIEHAIEEAQHP